MICLDSHDSDRALDGAMIQWLKTDLAETKAEWIVAFFHHPPYTKGTHDSDKDSDSGGRMNDMRANFLPRSRPAALTSCSPATRTCTNVPFSSTATMAKARRSTPPST